MKASASNATKPVAKTTKKVGSSANKDGVSKAKPTSSSRATPVRKGTKPAVRRKSVAKRRSGSPAAQEPAVQEFDLKSHTDALTGQGYTVIPTTDFKDMCKSQLDAEHSAERSNVRIDLLNEMVRDRENSILNWKVVASILFAITVVAFLV